MNSLTRPAGPLELLVRILDGQRSLTGAACKGRHELFDESPQGTTRTEVAARRHAATALCRTCPVLDACRLHDDQTNPYARPAGVVAGRIYAPGRGSGKQSVRVA